MKIYLCNDMEQWIKQSGIGQATAQQKLALELAQIPYTLTNKNEYDIIHLNTIFPQSYFKAKKAKQKGKAVIFHAHSTVEDFKDSFFFANALLPLFSWWLKKCYRTADLLLTPSNYSKALLENYKLDTPIEVISNGIVLSDWQCSTEEEEFFRHKYQLKMNDPLIISVGLPIKRKGLLDFIEMAKQLPAYQFIWFGYTNPNLLTKEIKEALQSNLSNLQFPGYIPHDELRVAYQTCDVFLFLTHEETEGIVLLEALASKTNVIVRDIPIFRDEYIDGENIYKGSTLDDFVRITSELLQKKRLSLVGPAYDTVKKKSIEQTGQKLKSYYQKLLHGYYHKNK